MRIGERLNIALEAFKANAVAYIVGGLIAGILACTGILLGPAMVGLYAMVLKGLRKETVEIGDVFLGFQNAGATIILGIVLIVACILPCCLGGLVLGPPSAYMFLHMAESKGEWKPSFMFGFNLLKKDFMAAWVFPFVVSLIAGLAGIIPFATLVTFPIAYLMIGVAYNEAGGMKAAD